MNQGLSNITGQGSLTGGLTAGRNLAGPEDIATPLSTWTPHQRTNTRGRSVACNTRGWVSVGGKVYPQAFRDKCVKQVKGGKPILEVARERGLSYCAVKTWCRSAGVKGVRFKRPDNIHDWSEIDDLIRSKQYSDRAIAESLGRHSSTIRRRRQDLGLAPARNSGRKPPTRFASSLKLIKQWPRPQGIGALVNNIKRARIKELLCSG